MYRGTTPTLYLELETKLDLTTVSEMWVTFRSSTVEITKSLSEAEIVIDAETNTVSVLLTQEDTLSLFNGAVEVQVRFRVGEGNNALAYATDIAKVDVGKILKEGVI